jgi:hypothetical protein
MCLTGSICFLCKIRLQINAPTYAVKAKALFLSNDQQSGSSVTNILEKPTAGGGRFLLNAGKAALD